MIIGQNTEQYADFVICDEYDQILDTSLFETIEFTFDSEKSKYQLIKYWPQDSSIKYNEESKIFSVLLTQEETKNWNSQIPVQIRILFKNGLIDSSEPEMWYVRPCLNKEVIKHA